MHDSAVVCPLPVAFSWGDAAGIAYLTYMVHLVLPNTFYIQMGMPGHHF